MISSLELARQAEDLRAQWAAVEAARDSADWAYVQLWLTGGGLIIGLVTVVAAVLAARYAKTAAFAAEAERRAWLRIDGVAVSRITVSPPPPMAAGGTIVAEGQFKLHNYGRHPATKVVMKSLLWAKKSNGTLEQTTATKALLRRLLRTASTEAEYCQIIFPGDAIEVSFGVGSHEQSPPHSVELSSATNELFSLNLFVSVRYHHGSGWGETIVPVAIVDSPRLSNGEMRCQTAALSNEEWHPGEHFIYVVSNQGTEVT